MTRINREMVPKTKKQKKKKPRANLPVRSTVGITNGGFPSSQVNIVLTLGSSLPVSARSYLTALSRLFGDGRLLLLCCTP